MTQNDTDKLVQYWLKAAEMDMQTAVEIHDNTKKYVSVLFYIHLSLEKILKALYVTRKKEHAPFSHNLIYLAKHADLELSDKDTRLLTEINDFNIECRYPDEKFRIYKTATAGFTGKYLKNAGEFMTWISEKLKNGQ